MCGDMQIYVLQLQLRLTLSQETTKRNSPLCYPTYLFHYCPLPYHLDDVEERFLVFLACRVGSVWVVVELSCLPLCLPSSVSVGALRASWWKGMWWCEMEAGTGVECYEVMVDVPKKYNLTSNYMGRQLAWWNQIEISKHMTLGHFSRFPILLFKHVSKNSQQNISYIRRVGLC